MPAQSTMPKLSVGASSFTPNAKPFMPRAPVAEPPKPREPTPPPRDAVVEQFKRWTHTERETNDFKEIVKKLATRKESEPISMDIFKQIQNLEIGKKHEDFEYVTNKVLIERSIKQMVESKKGNFRQNNNNNKNRDNRGEGNFNKNQYPKTPKQGGGGGGGGKAPGLWREEDVGEKNKLKQIAIKNHENAKKDKNENQKIRLILNIIAPDNYVRKFAELRGFLFANLKKRDECEEEKIEYDEDVHKLKEGCINEEILKTIVDNIFRKA